MNTKMIEVENLSFSYGRRKSKVLEDFSMKLDKGSVYGLLGKNGTGKSTLLYLMAGLLRPQTGNVFYKGVDVKKRYPDTLQDMFLVPEEFALPNVSLKQYVKLNAPFYPNFSDELLNACLRDFDMNEDIHLGELSMGQKKNSRQLSSQGLPIRPRSSARISSSCARRRTNSFSSFHAICAHAPIHSEGFL